MKKTAAASNTVYYIKTKDRESLPSILQKLEILLSRSGVLGFIKKDDFTAMKLHFGEKGNKGHIRPECVRLIGEHVFRITENVFVTDSNVLYKASSRTNSVDHLKIAAAHGFDYRNLGIPVLIADGLFGRNYAEIDIAKKHFSHVKIASEIASCDSLLILTHITGHIQTGFAGALKNLGMGCASKRGKFEQHCGVVPEVKKRFCAGCGLCIPHCTASALEIQKGKIHLLETRCIGCGECIAVCRTRALETKWSETLEKLQEKMVEYACGAVKAVRERVGYISFIAHVTKNCDCLATDEDVISKDLGILASADPVSIDKAAADLLNEMNGRDIFREHLPEPDWTKQLSYAAQLGLGSIEYKLEKL